MTFYYFTRSGNSETLAKELAKKRGSVAYKIDDGKNWRGIIGFIKGGYYAMSCKSLPAHYRKPESNEQIVLVMPLWAGTFPPAVRTFIEEISRERIILVVTSGSGKITDRKGFVQVIDAVGKNHDIKAITAAIR